MDPASVRTTVDFWFDPSCPYTWITSRWLVEVTGVRPVDVRWRVMSLAVLNEGREDNPEDPDGQYDPADLAAWLWAPVRLGAAVEQRFGSDALGRLFTVLGAAMHVRGKWLDTTDVLRAAGLPLDLAGAVESAAYDDAVRDSHAAAMALVGPSVGTPVIGIEGAGGERVGFFGPVVSPAPRGEEAGMLWDGFGLMARTPGFFELKRGRTGEPDVG